MKCANKNDSADLKSERVGNCEIVLDNGNIVQANKGIFSDALK